MRKKVLSLVLIGAMMLTACGNKEKVKDYPGDSNVASGTDVEKTEEKDAASDSSVNKDGKVQWSAIGSDKEVEVNAEVIGSDQDIYPVGEIAFASLSDEYVASVSDAVFDPGSVTVIMPYGRADLDYINHRLEVLEERKKAYGDEVPGYINLESAALTKKREQNRFEDSLECPTSPKVIDISEWITEKNLASEKSSFAF